MKVLLISPQPPPYGGIANWTAMMLEYVKSTNDSFDTINIAPKKRATEGRSLFDRVVVSGLDMLKKRHELKEKIKNNRPDVIHMTTSGSLAIFRDILLLKAAAKHGVPAVYHIRFGKTAEMAENNTKMWSFFKKAMLLANTVIAIDKKTYEAIKKHIPNANVVLLPNPINTSKLPEYNGELKKQVVFLGWAVPTKGLTELVAAWNTVGKEYPDYKLVVIGQSKPEYLETLKASVKVDNIEFMGEIPHDKAMETVAESEIFILPSYTEGFPNAVVEAMALKKAVIATDVGAIPEMLEDDCGVLIKPKNIDEIVIALRKVLSNKGFRIKLSENALNKVNSEYDIKIVYNRYKEIWDNAKELKK